MRLERLEADYRHLELATDAAVQLTEMEWRASGLSDEDRVPEYAAMFRKLRALNQRSVREPLQYTDPKALFELVCYAKHLGMWKCYRQNQVRLRYVDLDEPIAGLPDDQQERRPDDGQMMLFGEPGEET